MIVFSLVVRPGVGREGRIVGFASRKRLPCIVRLPRRPADQEFGLDFGVFELATTNVDTARSRDVGVKRSRSPLLSDRRLPSVLSPMNAVMTHADIRIAREEDESPMSPARRRITQANTARTTMEARLAILKPPVSSTCRPPHAMEIGRMPTARRNWRTLTT